MNDIIIDGKLLYEMRIRSDLTLQQAADRIGIHKSTLCRYELQEPARIRPEVMDRIRRVYQVEPDQMARTAEPASDSGWYRLLTPEEVSRMYQRLPEREKLRVSYLLAISR